MNNTGNPCFLCSKQRIVAKTYIRKNAGSPVTHTFKICPDKDCQKKVNLILARERAKRQGIMDENIKATAERLKRIRMSREKRV